MVDPMTSNGLSAALRHAEEAAELIVKARGRKSLPFVRRHLYNRRTVDIGRFFNCGIESLIYDRPVRSRIGVLNAGDAYTIPAWLLNHLYSRFRPRGVFLTALFSVLLNTLRFAAVVYRRYCELLSPKRNPTYPVSANG